jgi:hypothetical protein
MTKMTTMMSEGGYTQTDIISEVVWERVQSAWKALSLSRSKSRDFMAAKRAVITILSPKPGSEAVAAVRRDPRGVEIRNALGVSKAFWIKRFRPRFDLRTFGYVIKDGASKRQQHAALKAQAVVDMCHDPELSTIDNTANRRVIQIKLNYPEERGRLRTSSSAQLKNLGRAGTVRRSN